MVVRQIWTEPGLIFSEGGGVQNKSQFRDTRCDKGLVSDCTTVNKDSDFDLMQVEPLRLCPPTSANDPPGS